MKKKIVDLGITFALYLMILSIFSFAFSSISYTSASTGDGNYYRIDHKQVWWGGDRGALKYHIQYTIENRPSFAEFTAISYNLINIPNIPIM